MTRSSSTSRSMLTAMLCAAAVTAQFVGGKATRDALFLSARFDPHTAKRRFGQIAGIGTLGGLLSAILAERMAALLSASAMLPCLAIFHLASAALVRRLATQSDDVRTKGRVDRFGRAG